MLPVQNTKQAGLMYVYIVQVKLHTVVEHYHNKHFDGVVLGEDECHSAVAP